MEKYRGLVAHGAHIASVGSRIQKENGVIIDKKQFARDWMRICGSRVDEDLLWLFINRSEEAFEWLLECGGGHVDAVLFGGNYCGHHQPRAPLPGQLHRALEIGRAHV